MKKFWEAVKEMAAKMGAGFHAANYAEFGGPYYSFVRKGN